MNPNKKQLNEVEKFSEDILREEYYDILSTEDCFVEHEEELSDNIILGYN